MSTILRTWAVIFLYPNDGQWTENLIDYSCMWYNKGNVLQTDLEIKLTEDF